MNETSDPDASLPHSSSTSTPVRSSEAADTPRGSHPTASPNPTRQTLLQAGRHLFARRGYDGASIRAITREAGTNLGAVTYHFGSKRDFYEAVLGNVLGSLGERVVAAAGLPGTPGPGAGSPATPGTPAGSDRRPKAPTTGECSDPLARLDTVVRAIFGHLLDNPDIPQLILQEIAAGKGPPPAVSETLRTIAGTLGRIIAAGQEADEIREGDPELLAISSVIQPVHLVLVRRWLAHLKDLDFSDAADRERVVEHTIRYVRAGLAPRQEDPS